jgi:hypothetical protein
MAFDPYSSAKPYFKAGGAPGWVVSEEDKNRLQSYELYERIYWTSPQTFQVLQRGTDSAPIYLPTARKIIEACNRFLAVDFGYLVEGTDEGVSALIASLFKREKFFTKFATQKRYGLIRGDAVWHLVADPTRPEGERLSLYELDPSNYFPIMDPDNPEKRIGCYLVDIITDPNDPNASKKIARVQTYRKVQDNPGGPVTITSEMAHYEPAGWDARNLAPKDVKLLRVVKPVFALPPEITSIPVYPISNTRIPGPRPFGYSEILGIERVFAAVNQAVSDEELSLAMAGLGVFWTTAGPPKDAVTGRIVPWDIGPARMIEVGKDSKVERLQGITSVAPMIDHMNFILDETAGGIGIPDIAAGKVDVTVAESGISLQLQLSPLLAKNSEKEDTMIEEYDQMFYDIVHAWLPAYEGTTSAPEVNVVSVVGDPMPKNRKADIAEVMDLVTAGILSKAEARKILKSKFGYDIAEDVTKLLEEAGEFASAQDAFANRAAGELNDTGAAGQQQDGSNNGVVVPEVVA